MRNDRLCGCNHEALPLRFEYKPTKIGSTSVMRLGELACGDAGDRRAVTINIIHAGGTLGFERTSHANRLESLLKLRDGNLELPRLSRPRHIPCRSLLQKVMVGDDTSDVRLA